VIRKNKYQMNLEKKDENEELMGDF
jgi:hypothetical protein